jgi:hypothetical protein
MDIPAAISLNKTLLARIVAGLFGLLGLAGNDAPALIPARLHRSIARVLLSAESAARRLIVVLARIAQIKAPPPRPAPAGLVRSAKGRQRRSFPLFDPRQDFLRQQPPAKKAPPPQPRISFFGDDEVRTIAWGQLSSDVSLEEKEINPAHLLRRLEALKSALDDLPHQARRLMRALARRAKSPRQKFVMPLRPGHAPGFRRRPQFEIDHVLQQCDWLARETLAPDTS